MSLLMDALKKAEKEKKEAAKRRQTGQHPVLDTSEQPLSEDDTQLSITDTQLDGSEPTQEVSLELQPMDESTLGGATLGGDTSETGFTNTQLLNSDDDARIDDDDTLLEDTLIEDTLILDEATEEAALVMDDKVDDLDLDMENTQQLGDVTDETIIERTVERMMEEDDDISHADDSQTMDFTNTDEFHHENTDELQTSLVEDNLDDATLGLRLETIEQAEEQKPAETEFTAQPDSGLSLDDTDTGEGYSSTPGQLTDPSMELEALDSVSITQMLRDIGHHEGQPTPAAASTVFAASKNENRSSKLGYGLAAALALLLVVIGGLFIHYQTTPEVPEVMSPTVARGVEARKPSTIDSLTELTVAQQADSTVAQSTVTETISDEPVETIYIDETAAQAVAQTESDAQPPVLEQSATTEPAVSELAESESVTETSVVDAMDVAAPTTADAGVEATVQAREAQASEASQQPPVQPSSTAPAVAAPARDAIVYSPVATPVSPSMIKITRSRSKPRPEFGTNQRAYEAFQQGQYDVAASIYRISLRQQPDNRDALLGLAAVNLKTGDQQAAYQLYRRVLKLNPKDPVARLSMINLQGQGAAGNTSQLKSLIQNSPDNHNLHFSLGNQYAQQQRWPEAQQAFFEAYTRQPENPDYAVNLAISLDQMGQARAALEYYQRASELAKNQPASFNQSAIIARMDAIRQAN